MLHMAPLAQTQTLPLYYLVLRFDRPGSVCKTSFTLRSPMTNMNDQSLRLIRLSSIIKLAKRRTSLLIIHKRWTSRLEGKDIEQLCSNSVIIELMLPTFAINMKVMNDKANHITIECLVSEKFLTNLIRHHYHLWQPWVEAQKRSSKQKFANSSKYMRPSNDTCVRYLIHDWCISWMNATYRYALSPSYMLNLLCNGASVGLFMFREWLQYVNTQQWSVNQEMWVSQVVHLLR